MSIHLFIIFSSIHAFGWQAYFPSTGKVTNSRAIRSFHAPLKIRNGVNIFPLSVTVAASMTCLVSDVEDLC
jgi:hypothetical protein